MSSDILLAAASLVTAAMLPMMFNVIRGRSSRWVGPQAIFAISILGGFLIPLIPFLEGTDGFLLRYFTDVDAWRAAPVALWLATAGAFSFAVGFGIAPKRTNALEQGVFYLDPSRFALIATIVSAAAFGMFGLGVTLIGGPSALFTALGDRIRAFEGKNYLFQSVNAFLSVSIVWFAQIASQEQPLWRHKGFWLYLVLSLSLVGMLGNKSTLLVALLSLTVIYEESRSRLSLWIVVIGGTFSILALVAYGIFAREYLVTGALQTITTFDKASIVRVVETELSGNFIQLQTLSILVDRMPESLPWQYGRTFASLLTMPIPRALLPEKPLPSTGPFTQAFFPDAWGISGTTIPPGLLGEFYMNFGAVGIWLGMLLMGWLYGRTYEQWRKTGSRSMLLAYSLFIGLLPHYIRGESVAPTVTFLMIYLPALLVLRVCGIRASN